MTRIAVILAGGKASRMGGVDKATAKLAGKRMIDHVIERLRPQVDRILISGSSDYKTELINIPDRKGGPSGPAAGLWSVLNWLRESEPKATGFLTAPIDGPFLAPDLYEKLHQAEASAIAVSEDGDHPTFAWWRLEDLEKSFPCVTGEKGIALYTLAQQCAARRIAFPQESLRNINTPEDLKKAEAGNVSG